MSYVPNGFKSAFPNGSLTRHDRTVFSDAPFPDHAITRSPSTTARNKIARTDDSACPIIVHSHLCWDWVWQRPQQFVSRLSRRHKILFVETIGPDATLAAPLARFRTAENFPNVTLLRLQFPAWRWGDANHVDSERRRL